MKGIAPYQTPSINQLIAAYGNDIVNVITGLGFGVNISTSHNVEFDTLLDSMFFQNFTDTPLSYNGSKWTREHVSKVPLSKFLQAFNNRMYFGYTKIGSVEYPSRVWFSDLPINDTIQWGYEQKTNLTTTAGSNRVGSANAGFVGYNIKVGDPFFITSGSDAGEYKVEEIISDQELNLADINGAPTKLVATDSSVAYWVGSNYFDVDRDDGDFITWLEYNFDQLIIYKRESIHRYNGSTRKKVFNTPGTTSGRSVINIGDWTVHFYGGLGLKTGFYAYDGTQGFKISDSIQKYIDGINPNMFFSVVAWEEGNLYRCYVGDIRNSDHDISIDKAVITLDFEAKSWSVDPIDNIIVAATTFREINTISSYISTTNQVLKSPSGSTYNGTPITWSFTTKHIYPEDTSWNNTFTRLQVLSEHANGIKVSYRRLLAPLNSDDKFTALGDIRNQSQWFKFREEMNRSSGIQLKFSGISSTKPVALIKKLLQYYRKETNNVTP